MKRILLMIALCFSLIGCGKDEDGYDKKLLSQREWTIFDGEMGRENIQIPLTDAESIPVEGTDFVKNKKRYLYQPVIIDRDGEEHLNGDRIYVSISYETSPQYALVQFKVGGYTGPIKVIIRETIWKVR